MDLKSTILIVDDEPTMREALGEFLAAEGYNVALASNGQEALAQATELAPDLILLDILMPGMDGFEVCRRLRADPLLAEVPIVMVTALNDYKSRLRGFEAGGDDFISKPFDEIELQARVRTITRLDRYRRLLQERTQRQQAEQALQHRVELEETVAAISTRLIGPVDVDQAIHSSLKEIGELAGASRAYVFLFRQDGSIMDNTHEWCAEGVTPQVDNLQNLPGHMFPWWMNKLERDKEIHIQDVSRLPAEAAAEKEMLESQNIKSLLVLPLHIEGELAGFIGLDNVTAAREWSHDDLALLRLAAEILGSGLERVRVEEALRESEERYRTLFEGVPVGLYRTTQDGQILDVNPALVEMLGFPDQETALGANAISGYADPEDRARWQALMDREEQVRDFEAQWRRRDGAVIWVEESARVVRDDEGRVLYYEGAMEDITERKRAEEALQESKELFEKTFISQRDALFILDAKIPPSILDCNPATTEVFGYIRQEMLGRTTTFLHADETTLREFQEHLYPAIAESGFLHLPEFEMKRKDGTVFVTEHSVIPLEDEQGRRTGWVSVVRDITERKRAEEALREREGRLRDLAKYLQETREKERTRIAREIHDEFSQSLTALKMDLSWLTKRLPADKPHLTQKAGVMSDLIDATIHTVRRVATELRPGLLDDLGLAAAIEWQTQEFAERTEIECELYMSDDEMTLDRNLVTAVFRIFQETLTNVARHAEASEVRIRLEDKPDELLLIVRDNGQGMASNAVSDARSLGLMGMRERALSWGGEVTFESAPGQGTTVTLRLPRRGREESER